VTPGSNKQDALAFPDHPLYLKALIVVQAVFIHYKTLAGWVTRGFAVQCRSVAYRPMNYE
jgi:hypothetical protein